MTSRNSSNSVRLVEVAVEAGAVEEGADGEEIVHRGLDLGFAQLGGQILLDHHDLGRRSVIELGRGTVNALAFLAGLRAMLNPAKRGGEPSAGNGHHRPHVVRTDARNRVELVAAFHKPWSGRRIEVGPSPSESRTTSRIGTLSLVALVLEGSVRLVSAEGERVGLLEIRSFRPFPVTEVARALAVAGIAAGAGAASRFSIGLVIAAGIGALVWSGLIGRSGMSSLMGDDSGTP